MSNYYSAFPFKFNFLNQSKPILIKSLLLQSFFYNFSFKFFIILIDHLNFGFYFFLLKIYCSNLFSFLLITQFVFHFMRFISIHSYTNPKSIYFQFTAILPTFYFISWSLMLFPIILLLKF